MQLSYKDLEQIREHWDEIESITDFAARNKIRIIFNPNNYLCEMGANYLAKILKNTEILVLNNEEATLLAGKDYISTYEQFGWKNLGRMASVNIWRMEYKDNRPEAFTDKDSIASRNNRTIAAVSVSFSIFLLAVLAMSIALIFFSDMLSANDRMQLIIGAVFSIVLAILLGTVMLYIYKGNKK